MQIPSESDGRVEPIVLLLVGLVLFFTLVLIGIAVFLSSDGQTFQVIANLVAGFSGALLMRVKPRGSPQDPPDPLPASIHRTVESRTESQTLPPPDGKG